jgi:hypothetical protein
MTDQPTFETLLDRYGQAEFECGHYDDASRKPAREAKAALVAHINTKDEEIARLEQQNAALRDVLSHLIVEIGSCRCHEAFTSRRLEDPACQFHLYSHILTEQLKAALK